MAFVVAVGDEAQRQREAREQQRPRVQVGDRAPAGEADPRHAVMEMLAVGAIQRLSVLQALEQHEGGVQEGHREQDQRQHERDHRGGLDGRLNRYHPHQQAQQVGPAVAHETRRRREVVEQEAERGAGGEGRQDRRLRAAQIEGDDRHRRGDDRAHPRRETVHAVGEVDHVHNRHEADHRQQRAGVGDARVGEREFADEGQRDRLDGHAEVHRDHRRHELPDELHRRMQVEAIVEGPHDRDHGRREQHAVPQLGLVFPQVDDAGRQPDPARDERTGEDRQPAQQRRRAFGEAAVARFIDRADEPRQAHRERRQQGRHGGGDKKCVKRVELVRMRHRLSTASHAGRSQAPRPVRARVRAR